MQITRKFCLESGWVLEFSEMEGGGGLPKMEGELFLKWGRSLNPSMNYVSYANYWLNSFFNQNPN